MSQDQAKQFLDQASQCIQNEQYNQALDFIDQALQIKPKDSEAHILRGVSLAHLNQPQAATDAFRQAILNGPYNSKAYYNLAVHFYSLGEKQQALEMAREAFAVDARHSGARELIARIDEEYRKEQGVKGPSTGNDNAPPGDSLLSAEEGADPVTVSSSGTPPPPARAHDPSDPLSAPAPAAPPKGTMAAQYVRPGEESYAAVHSLPFVENLGKSWETIGWCLIVFSFLGLGIAGLFAMRLGLSTSLLTDSRTMKGAMLLPNLLCFFGGVGMFFWTLLDIMDRRGNYGWLIASAICGCCCSSSFLIGPIYMLAGRKND